MKPSPSASRPGWELKIASHSAAAAAGRSCAVTTTATPSEKAFTLADGAVTAIHRASSPYGSGPGWVAIVAPAAPSIQQPSSVTASASEIGFSPSTASTNETLPRDMFQPGELMASIEPSTMPCAAATPQPVRSATFSPT